MCFITCLVCSSLLLVYPPLKTIVVALFKIVLSLLIEIFMNMKDICQAFKYTSYIHTKWRERERKKKRE